MRRLLALVALSTCVLAPLRAHAQSIAATSPSTAKVEGPGVGLGDSLVLHVGAGAELRYDSNVFYQSTDETQALALHLSPAFAISTKTAQRDAAPHKIDFRLGAGLDYIEWLVANTGVRPPRQFNVLASGDLRILPNGPFATEIFDNFIRASQPTYQPTTYNLDRDINEVGARFRIKPGGGRLELQATGIFGIDFWEHNPAALNAYSDYYGHETLRLLWKFLPKTAVYVQGDAYEYDYYEPLGSTVHPNGDPLRVTAGLNGLLTAKLSFDIYGGYINGFYRVGPTLSTGLAGLSLTWKPIALSTFTLAYRHDAINALLGVFAEIDNVSLSWTQQIWRFTGFLRAAYQNTRYQGIPEMAGGAIVTGMTQDRTDNGFTLNARVDYFAFRNFIALSLGYDFNLVRTTSGVGAGGTPINPLGIGIFPENFNKHEVYLGLSVFY